MAAAEARTAWQRAVNRCLAQEDAKRAPKLACYPSSTPQNDSSNGNAAISQDYPSPNFMPLNRKCVNPNLSPETKWWLHLQPNFGYQNDFICEHLCSLEDEIDEKDKESTVPTSKMDGESLPVDSIDFVLEKGEHFVEPPWMVSTAFMKYGSEPKVKEMNITSSSSQLPPKHKTNTGDYLCKEEEFMDLKPINRSILKGPGKASLDLETPWAGANTPEPWWRIEDKDELALLVAQKSMELIENCDLPKPTHMVHVANPLSSIENLDTSGRFQSSSGGKSNAGTCNTNECSRNISSFGMPEDKNFSPSEEGHMQRDLEKLHRSAGVHVKDEQPGINQTFKKDATRAQLLEALCHSQTRARKAEVEAQKAYVEKEHIVKLLFREASHLFAYKQWLQMLQLESLYLQLKIKDCQIPTRIPVLPPWMPLKGKLFGKEKISRKKGRKKNICSICKYAVLFAVGLGLAGVGLLFGWTIGWLFSTV